MKYGIHFSYWSSQWSASYSQFIARAAACGFDLLEISCSGLVTNYTTASHLSALKEYAMEQGIQLTAGCGLTPGRNLCSLDSAVVNDAISFFSSLLPKLQCLGIHTLAGPLYSYAPVDFSTTVNKPAELRRAIHNIRTVSKIAADCDVTMMLEVVNRYEGYLLNTCAEALDFVDAVGSNSVKVMLDTFHMSMEENSLPGAIRMAGNQLGHLHIAEQNRRVPGQGTLAWHDISEALKDISYNGALVIEAFVRQAGEVSHKAMLWRDLVSNPTDAQLDRDAAASLQFLHHTFKSE